MDMLAMAMIIMAPLLMVTKDMEDITRLTTEHITSHLTWGRNIMHNCK